MAGESITEMASKVGMNVVANVHDKTQIIAGAPLARVARKLISLHIVKPPANRKRITGLFVGGIKRL